MEQGPEKTPGITVPSFKVLWHPDTRGDLGKLPRDIREKIIETAAYKLSRAPQFIGQPLKGTRKFLWKIRFSKYRIVYTMTEKAREVWILSVGKRDSVYRNEFIQSWPLQFKRRRRKRCRASRSISSEIQVNSCRSDES